MSDLFDIIEKVVSERKDQRGRYTGRQLIIDVTKLAAKHDPEMAFSSGDLRAIATRLGLANTTSTYRQALNELVLVGEIEFAGKEARMNNIGFEQPVPVYRATSNDEA
jgi:hypothetical protein